MDIDNPPPLPRIEIDALPIIEVHLLQNLLNHECSICKELFLMNQLAMQLPCFHIYHLDCVRPWLELHAICPLCRSNLLDRRRYDNSGEIGPITVHESNEEIERRSIATNTNTTTSTRSIRSNRSSSI